MPAPTIIKIPQPEMGGKVYLVETKGLFVLEEGPVIVRAISCTHAGSGGLVIYDGVPDERGFFKHDAKPGTPEYAIRNGRRVFLSHPVVMGAWMLDAGLYHGLTVDTSGGTDGVFAVVTIVWMPVRRKA